MAELLCSLLPGFRVLRIGISTGLRPCLDRRQSLLGAVSGHNKRNRVSYLSREGQIDTPRRKVRLQGGRTGPQRLHAITRVRGSGLEILWAHKSAAWSTGELTGNAAYTQRHRSYVQRCMQSLPHIESLRQYSLSPKLESGLWCTSLHLQAHQIMSCPYCRDELRVSSFPDFRLVPLLLFSSSFEARTLVSLLVCVCVPATQRVPVDVTLHFQVFIDVLVFMLLCDVELHSSR